MSEGEAARGSFAIPGSKSEAASAEGDYVPKNIFLTGGAGEFLFSPTACFAAHHFRFFSLWSLSLCTYLRCTRTHLNAPMLTLVISFNPSFSSYSQVSSPRMLPSCCAKNIRSTMVNILPCHLCRLVYWLAVAS